MSPHAYIIALDEARALRLQAMITHERLLASAGKIDRTADIGSMLAALLTIGFCLELYLKAFMTAARDGHVLEGHDLTQLYAEFPLFIKVALEERYSRDRLGQWTVPVVGLRTSSKQPTVPNDDAAGRSAYGSFETALAALSNAFVRARYFYEEVNGRGWATFDYAVEPALFLVDALDKVFEDWQKGAFRGLGR